MTRQEIKKCLQAIKDRGYSTVGLAGNEIDDDSILGRGCDLMFIIEDPNSDANGLFDPRVMPTLRKDIQQIKPEITTSIMTATDFKKTFGNQTYIKTGNNLDNFQAVPEQSQSAPPSPSKKTYRF